MKTIMSFVAILLACVTLGGEADSIKSVEAQQRYPWNGLVDITVTIEGSEDDIAEVEWSFVATNIATGAAVPVANVSQNGSATGSGTTWTLQFVWNATNDVGEVKIDNLALTVNAGKALGDVQLWENGPYWAECNVGATKPEEFGYYFWWGDTVGYKRNASNDGWVSVKDGTSFQFSNLNCPTSAKDNSELQARGYIDSTGNLVAAYDAATAHLGSPWRMPTKAEFSALISNCTTTWTTRNGVCGRLVTGVGAYASKSIFIPAAGNADAGDLNSPNSYGFYWSSSPKSSFSAWRLIFTSDDILCYDDFCRYGRPVRPLRSRMIVGSATTCLTLDSRTRVRECSADGEQLCYDIRWYDGAESISIVDNGVVIGSGTVGSLLWQPNSCIRHSLQLKAFSNDGSEVGSESSEFVVDHVEVVTTEAKAATCTEDGRAKGSYCSRCDAVLSVSETTPALGHQEIVTQPAIDPVGTSPGYTAEVKCSHCGITFQERTIVWAEGVVVVSSVTAQQRYPWNGLVDVVVTLQGDTNAITQAECTFVANNCATRAEVPVTDIEQLGVDSFENSNCVRRYLWNAASDVGEVKIDNLALTVNAEKVIAGKMLGGVQLWENGPYWAECNVGATKPEEYGYYFWWGDTVGYKRNANNDGWVSVKDGTSFQFSYPNCPTDAKDSSKLQTLGYIDSTGNLVAAHDAAAAHLGSPWRMPTKAEFSVLISNCTTTWTTRNGVCGRLVTGVGAYASKSIFIPAAGNADINNLNSPGSYGFYWSSSPNTNYTSNAWRLFFTSDDILCSDDLRRYGRPIRPLRGDEQGGVSRIIVGSATTYLTIDSRTCVRECSVDGEQLCYDIRWYDGAESVRIVDNGVVIGSGTVGSLLWQPNSCIRHSLQLKALANDGSEVGSESSEFVVDHVEVVTTAEKAATCTENGCTKGSYCGRGDAILSVSETIPALGHQEVVTTEAKAATCTEDGRTKGSYCSRCDAVLSASETTPALGHQEIVTRPAIDPAGTSPGYTAEVKCSHCGITLQERTIVWAEGAVIVSSVTARQRYPWNGLVDVVVALQGDTNAITQAECTFVATNCATQAEVPVTDIEQLGEDSFENSNCIRRYLWNATNDVGAVKIDNLALTVVVKSLGGVQLWENGPYWAECNVGATKPEEFGYYFWWGDTEGYKRNARNNGWVSVKDGASFQFSSCPTSGKNNTTLQSQGYVDSTGNLVAAHDAATAHLGSPWRMPTEAEFSALISNCTTTWTTRNGVCGRLVTGVGLMRQKAFSSRQPATPTDPTSTLPARMAFTGLLRRIRTMPSMRGV